MSNYQTIWKSLAITDLRNSIRFQAFVESIRSYYYSKESLVDAENKILDIILEGYGNGVYFGLECNILETVIEYRVVLADRRNNRISYHNEAQMDKSSRHLYLAKINLKYMKSARNLFSRVQMALFPVSVLPMPIEEEEETK